MNSSGADAVLSLAQASGQTESDRDFYPNDFDLHKHRLCTGWTQRRMFLSLCESSRNLHANTTFGLILTSYFDSSVIHESRWTSVAEPTRYTDSVETHDVV